MGVALEAGYDLGGLAACYILIAFLEVLVLTLAVVSGVFNISILGKRPFAGISSAINNTAIRWANDALVKVERIASKFQSGLLEALYLVLGLPLLLLVGLRQALEYAWNEALHPVIHRITDPIRKTANEALAESVGAAQGVATGLATLEHEIGALRKDVTHDISSATHDLRGVLEGELFKGIDEVRGTALAAIDELARLEGAAIGAALDVAGKTLGELHDFEKRLPLDDIASVVAAVPLLLALVQVLEAETGLDRAVCRSKVKGICGVDPGGWEGLLAGALLIEGVLNFRELVEAARTIFGFGATLMREVA